MFLFSPVQPLLMIISMGLLIPLLLWALMTAHWGALLAASYRWRLWVFAIIFLGLLWGNIGINVSASFRVHPMLITSMTLIFGFRLSVIAGSASLFISALLAFGALNQHTADFLLIGKYLIWNNYATNCLLGVVVPATTCVIVLYVTRKINVQNLFIYTLGGGFLGGMLAMLSTGLISAGISNIFNEPSVYLITENLHLFLLLMFPEGFCNGAIVSTIAVTAPSWVKTYDHDFYLR